MKQLLISVIEVVSGEIKKLNFYSRKTIINIERNQLKKYDDAVTILQIVLWEELINYGGQFLSFDAPIETVCDTSLRVFHRNIMQFDKDADIEAIIKSAVKKL